MTPTRTDFYRRVKCRRVVAASLLMGVWSSSVLPATALRVETARTQHEIEAIPVPTGRIVLVARCLKVCELAVEHVPARGSRTSVVLPWPAPSPDVREEPAGASWGAVDLLAPAGADIAWASGVESEYVSTSLRTLAFPDGTIGVVADQLAGFEHLVHAHVFAVLTDGRLRELRRWVGTGSPTLTALTVVDGEVVFQSWFADPDPSRADEVSFSAFRLDRLRSRLVSRPRRSPVYAVVAEQFATVVAARDQQTRAFTDVDANGTPCLAGFGVFASSVLRRPGSARWFIGALTSRRNYADAAAASLRRCTTRFPRAVVVRVG